MIPKPNKDSVNVKLDNIQTNQLIACHIEIIREITSSGNNAHYNRKKINIKSLVWLS